MLYEEMMLEIGTLPILKPGVTALVFCLLYRIVAYRQGLVLSDSMLQKVHFVPF